MERRTAHIWELLLVAAVAWMMHAVTLGNFLYTHDGWNDVLLGNLVLNGGLEWHENVFRLTPTLSFGLRALAGVSTVAWHFPNVFVHGVNAVLVLLLARRIGAGVSAARLAAVLFSVAPLLAHPVEWIGGTYDLFATAGVLGSALALMSGRTRLAVVLGLFGLTSKEFAVMLPVIAGCLLIAAEGWPKSWRKWLWRLAPLLLVTLMVGGVRIAQIQAAPPQAMAGRQVAADPVQFLGDAPAAVGIACAAPLTELVELREPAQAPYLGYTAFALLLAASVWQRRHLRAVIFLVIASVAALFPVSLIAMDLRHMVENARYLYLSAALVAPILPLLLLGRPHRVRHLLAILLLVTALWGGAERVARSVDQTRAVKAVANEVLSMPAGTRLWVLTPLYDEATARFLMSRWLHTYRGIKASYVLRGSWSVYGRRPEAGHDAAQSYFGREQVRLSPALVQVGDRILLQAPASGTVRELDSLRSSPAGSLRGLPGEWSPLTPPDPEDAPIRVTEGGRVLHVERRLGPIASAEIAPAAALEWSQQPAQLRRVVLSIRAQSDVQPRYGTGFHEQFALLFWGDASEWFSYVSFELIPDGQLHRVELDLTFDPVAAENLSTRLGLLPLNYPGVVTIEDVQVSP